MEHPSTDNSPSLRTNCMLNLLLCCGLVFGVLLACIGDVVSEEITEKSTERIDEPKIEDGRCRAIDPRDIVSPAAEILGAETQPGKSPEEFVVRGVVAGQCLTEAGYFERGQKVMDIAIKNEPGFRRFEFKLPLRLTQDGEIRVYNSSGGREAVEIPKQMALLRIDPHSR